jgi:uncharacterized protein (TIGR02996 family)
MVKIHPELKALLDTVCECRTDATAKLVLADWLDENGYCGESMRWAVRRCRRPVLISAGLTLDSAGDLSIWRGAGWGWRLDRHGLSQSCHPETLPKSVFGYTPKLNPFPSFVVSFSFESQAWLAFIINFGDAYKKGKIGRKRKTKEIAA